MTKADGNQTVHLQKTSSVLRDKPMLSGGLMCHLGTEAQSGEIPGLRQNVELAGDRAGKTSTPVFFFDRDPEIFRFVLDYYRTGELHLPTNICGPFARKELIYWGVDESFILPCCMPAYMRYEEERRIKKTLFRDCFEDIDSIKNLVKCCRGWKRWKYQIWLFLDHPSSSLAAKVSCILSSGYGKDFAQQTLSWNSVASEIALS
ncbi:unnamed protein product [Protopolystoma xenopodis]|uniref:Potassium channel tetramerisation-type BTB domain-containing protein n=1 Tax=Protopolystoma xenopodis TaxID=117903 RepID=A0A448XAI9_9PLAT|nr:unnamed protein product [Protopolystoma xenopodis]